MRFFRSSSAQVSAPAVPQKRSRRSSGMAEISRLLNSQEALYVLDLGSTSANNISFLTAKGHKNYSEDLLRAALDPALRVRDEAGKFVFDSKKFLEENLTYTNATFDVVLCWNLPDYMEESLVKPTIDRLWSVMKPGGLLLVFFHTRDAGPDAPCYRFHITGTDMLEMQEVRLAASDKQSPRLQRVFNNRHIENLFRDFASIKFFLARDAIREVLLVR
ncbi:MAG: class I SAM-dependent methyltransferase [Candidatus Koribacter versatilis]|nr:class I SAM-dependent methyltransferase [Candidatus Koribacter versatilis]